MPRKPGIPDSWGEPPGRVFADIRTRFLRELSVVPPKSPLRCEILNFDQERDARKSGLVALSG